MKTYTHVRLGTKDRALLEELKSATGRSESELLREGLRLIWRDLGAKASALKVAGRSSGRFLGGPKDLPQIKKHLAEFGH